MSIESDIAHHIYVSLKQLARLQCTIQYHDLHNRLYGYKDWTKEETRYLEACVDRDLSTGRPLLTSLVVYEKNMDPVMREIGKEYIPFNPIRPLVAPWFIKLLQKSNRHPALTQYTSKDILERDEEFWIKGTRSRIKDLDTLKHMCEATIVYNQCVLVEQRNVFDWYRDKEAAPFSKT